MEANKLVIESAFVLSELIKTGAITSQELIELFIERIKDINPKINAICTTNFEKAIEMAKNADAINRDGKKAGILNGIPVLIKDGAITEGIRTTFGSRIFENNIPTEDHITVKRLKDAGCIVLGKTNLPEFGSAAITDNILFGATKNPWNLKKTPGGSSGGSAAAVAARLSPIAMGGDSGGSIRIPCALCGVFGYKPSFGRVPVYPIGGISSDSLIHYGPITNFVKDAAMALDVLKGPFEGDRYSLPEDHINYTHEIEEKPSALKIGYSLDLGFVKEIDNEVQKIFLNSIEILRTYGWNVEEVRIELSMRKPERAYLAFSTALTAYDHKMDIQKYRDMMDPNLVKIIEAGLTYSGLDIIRSLAQRKELYETFYHYFENYDILLTPTTATPAFDLGIMFPPKINDKNVSPLAWMPYTFIFNLTGHPASTIPCGFSQEGLPMGLQIIGKRFDDLTVLQVSKTYEELTDWNKKVPAI